MAKNTTKASAPADEAPADEAPVETAAPETTPASAPASAPTTTKAKGKREPQTKRIWIDADGIEVKDIREAAGFEIEVIGAGKATGFLSDYPEAIVQGFALFGATTLLTNTFGGVTAEDASAAGMSLPAYRMELLLSRDETLRRGEWSERKGSDGPRVGLLAQAVLAAYEKAGRVNGRTLESIIESLKSDEAKRKSAMGSPAVMAEYARLQAEAADRRAAEAAAKAADATAELPDL